MGSNDGGGGSRGHPTRKGGSTTTNNKNNQKADKATRAGQLLAGTRKRFPNAGQTLTLDGAPVTVATLTGELQGFLDDHAAVAAAKATVKAKVAAEDARLVTLNALVRRSSRSSG